jgi:2-polyprenyl-3-methyl-5-hydroxy-6-metoxy-1,4-benzoquinol methylase
MAPVKIHSSVKTCHHSCIICNNRLLKTKFIVNGYILTKCQVCKHMFVNEIISQEKLDIHYHSKTPNKDIIEEDVYFNQANYNNLNYYYLKLRSIILKKQITGKILDIGCNTGAFLDVMKGYECYGVDRSPSYAKPAIEKYGNNIFIGSFEEYTPPDFFFDCITLQDVLDHMTDPVSSLKKCHKLLKPDGLLIVKVHDMSSFISKIMGKYFYGIIPPEHLSYFSRTSLRTALKKTGFIKQYSIHIGHRMFLSTVFHRLSKGNHKSYMYRIFKLISKTWLGNIPIYKNFHDIITVFAEKTE